MLIILTLVNVKKFEALIEISPQEISINASNFLIMFSQYTQKNLL